jgi:protein gp37
VERYGWAKWGKNTPRHRTSASYWRQPIKWDADAAKAGQRRRVFAFSLADVFEDRRDLDPWRADLWRLIEATPNLDWLLLTKRYDCIARMLPAAWLAAPRPNVWLGVTAENQRRAEERIPALLKVPAVVRWISAEPLLGPIDFRPWMRERCSIMRGGSMEESTGRASYIRPAGHADLVEAVGMIRAGTAPAYWLNPHGAPLLHWVIVGGESGANARRMDPGWALDILRQCRAAGVAYHFKQKGAVLSRELGCKDKAGKDPAEWPADFRVQEFPRPVTP